MTDIPKQMRSLVPMREILEVENWWEKLSDENQKELHSFYQEKSRDPDQLVSIQFCGRFVEQETTDQKDIFWVNHFYDYIVNHELIVDESPWIGGTCSANKAAERVLRKGLLPKDFSCPVADRDCLMMKLLNLNAEKRPMQFYLKFELA